MIFTSNIKKVIAIAFLCCIILNLFNGSFIFKKENINSAIENAQEADEDSDDDISLDFLITFSQQFVLNNTTATYTPILQSTSQAICDDKLFILFHQLKLYC